MAERRVTVLDCDKCGQPGDRYLIGYPSRKNVRIDLCPEHAKPLDELSGLGSVSKRGREVVTLEQIEAMKKRQGRK